MNYRDMLLMDYFDEDYDVFDEAYYNDKELQDAKNWLSKMDVQMAGAKDGKLRSKDWETYKRKKANIAETEKVNEWNAQHPNNKVKSLAALEKLKNQVGIGKVKDRRSDKMKKDAEWKSLGLNAGAYFDSEEGKKAYREFLKKNPNIDPSKAKDLFMAQSNKDGDIQRWQYNNESKVKASLKRNKQAKKDQELADKLNGAGAAAAANGEEPTPEKASKFARAKGYLKDHKAGAGAVGAGVGAAAGAAIAGKGIHDLATLKNPAKAKAAWKASGSNLPFDEWLKKEKRKAGIKTAIGGAAAAAGAAGAAYLGHKQVHQESLGELLNEFDDILMEEAYLEGYYGQILAESNGYENEYEMIMCESYDEYDDDDYYDEDYLGLPYFG